MGRLPDRIDQHVGARVRMRRLMVGISQTKLAEALEISSKQVQKYEKGVNRICAGRLQQIARRFGVPLAYFFDSAPGGDALAPGFAEPIGHSNSIAFVSDGQRLDRAFATIRDPEVRRNVHQLIATLAGDPQELTLDPRPTKNPCLPSLLRKAEETLTPQGSSEAADGRFRYSSTRASSCTPSLSEDGIHRFASPNVDRRIKPEVGHTAILGPAL